jgi:hypothetical protein
MFTSTIHDAQTNTLMITAPTATIKTIHALVITLLSHLSTRHYMLVYADNKAIHALINTLLSPQYSALHACLCGQPRNKHLENTMFLWLLLSLCYLPIYKCMAHTWPHIMCSKGTSFSDTKETITIMSCWQVVAHSMTTNNVHDMYTFHKEGNEICQP